MKAPSRYKREAVLDQRTTSPVIEALRRIGTLGRSVRPERKEVNGALNQFLEFSPNGLKVWFTNRVEMKNRLILS
jgi:hypothetical protein